MSSDQPDPSDAQPNERCANALIDGLLRGGLRHVCIAPGSRSTPLVLAAQHPSLTTSTHWDERGAAFFALGRARATRRPVAIVTTSGSAAANLLPAVVEADASGVPLILLTAARPAELTGFAAPQSLEQATLFSGFTRWFFQPTPPESSDELLALWSSLGLRAARTALGPSPGPVHLNLPFREPLAPRPSRPVGETATPTGRDRTRDEPPSPLSVRPSRDDLSTVTSAIQASRRGLIVAGPPFGHESIDEAAWALARSTGFPLLADPLSGARRTDDDDICLVTAYDAILRSPAAEESLRPDLILRLGGTPTSKPLYRAIRAWRGADQLIFGAQAAWRDEGHTATAVVAAPPGAVAHALAGDSAVAGTRATSSWIERWNRAERAARAVIDETLEADGGPAEACVVRALLRVASPDELVHVASSMPIRDLDTVCARGAACPRLYSNRGVNGIDGTLATGFGLASAGVRRGWTLLGDTAMLHDLSSLANARSVDASLVVVIINNDGGGIFHYLPVAAHGERFESHFVAPHGLTFQGAAAMFGFDYIGATAATVDDAFARARTHRRALVEVTTDRVSNVHAHRAMWRQVVERVDPLLETT